MTNINIPTGPENLALSNAPAVIPTPAAFASQSVLGIATALAPAVGALATLGIVGIGMKAIITGKNPLKSEKV
jgi:hypothetical protein